MEAVAVPGDYRVVFSRWCASQVPADRRDSMQIGYLIQGDEVTIIERHPPTFPELDAAWTSTPIAQLRYRDPEAGLWSLYVPAGEHWRRYEGTQHALRPERLLEEVELDPAGVFWGRRAS
jgi:hypothetical protein